MFRTAFDKFRPNLDRAMSNAGGWKPAPVANGVVNYAFDKPVNCAQDVHFVYFETQVEIPKGYTVENFTVSYGEANDAARIYFFNDANPNGKFTAAADLIRAVSANQQVNLREDVVPGTNRIVVAAFNQCSGGHVKGINLAINGNKIVAGAPAAPAAGGSDCFQLKATSVDGTPAQTAHYLAYIARNIEASGRAPLRVGDPKASAETVPLQLSLVDVGSGMKALKANNYPNPNNVDVAGKQPLVISADNGQMWIEYRPTTSADPGFITKIAPLGSGGNASFESKWAKTNGWYLRNQKSYGKLHPTSNPEYNKGDATWTMEACASLAVAPALPQQMYLFTYSVVGNIRPEGKMDRSKEYFLKPEGDGVKIVQGQPEKLIVEKLPNGNFKLKTSQNLYMGFVKKAFGSLQYVGVFGDAAGAEEFIADPATIGVCDQGQQPTKDTPCLTQSEAGGFVSLKAVSKEKEGYMLRHESYNVGLVAPSQFSHVKGNVAYNTLLGDTSWRFEKADQ